jgi:hypothetical protein
MGKIRILIAFLLLAIPAASFAQLRVAIAIGPPALPVYEQPICPGDGYLWTPGYWAYDDSVSDYYWVPGTWVMAPEVGFLWTPGYWGWGDGGFLWNEGFWGPTVGFYGGINYGFGYFGVGFGGGRWDNGHFFYNRAVMNVDVTVIHNVYNTRVENINSSHVSFNGGKGGIDARPTAQEEAASKERHVPPVASQTEHASAARSNPEMRAKSNHGDPPVKATAKPGDFSARAGAPAKEGEDHAGAGAAGEPRSAAHVSDLAPMAHPEPSNSGDAKADKKYQKEQDKLVANQEKERQKLQQQQEKDHQKKLNDAQHQQMEQRHQQQTQQLQQRHQQQMQSLQSRAPQPRQSAPRPR